jgi:hypothetical protein
MNYLCAELSDRLERGLSSENRRRGESLAQPCVRLTPLLQICIGGQFRLDGRPTAQWSRIRAGRADDLGTTPDGGLAAIRHT